MTDLIIAVLVVTGVLCWVSVTVLAVATLIIQGREWHREGMRRVRRDERPPVPRQPSDDLFAAWEREMS